MEYTLTGSAGHAALALGQEVVVVPPASAVGERSAGAALRAEVPALHLGRAARANVLNYIVIQ